MNAHATVTSAPYQRDDEATFANGYLEVVTLVENLHRLLLEGLKSGLEQTGLREVNPVQALLLFSVGSKDISPGELMNRGYYQGSNASYNLKKLIELGYMESRRSEFDGRSVRLRLTEKGMDVHFAVGALLQGQAMEFGSADWLGQNGILAMASDLRTLRGYWANTVRHAC